MLFIEHIYLGTKDNNSLTKDILQIERKREYYHKNL